jgi:hypothetical protein
MPAFARTIGVDYSGAETPIASLKGLRVYMSEGDGLPVEVQPSPSPRKYWSRKGIAEWLVDRLVGNTNLEAMRAATRIVVDESSMQGRVGPFEHCPTRCHDSASAPVESTTIEFTLG